MASHNLLSPNVKNNCLNCQQLPENASLVQAAWMQSKYLFLKLFLYCNLLPDYMEFSEKTHATEQASKINEWLKRKKSISIKTTVS